MTSRTARNKTAVRPDDPIRARLQLLVLHGPLGFTRRRTAHRRPDPDPAQPCGTGLDPLKDDDRTSALSFRTGILDQRHKPQSP